MAWPNNLNHITLTGFDAKYLPAIMRAIDSDLVEWGNCDLFLDLSTAKFSFAGCRWSITEVRETVSDISLTNGILTDEDLAVAFLATKPGDNS
jgi:hypothetical protein